MRRLFKVWAIAGFALLTPALALGSDQELAQQIAGNLRNSGRLKGYSISVKVQEGIVQLDGTVRSEKQLEQALAIAEVTPGIERVINNLSVKENQEGGSSLALRQPASIARGDKQVVRRAARPTASVRQASAETPAEEQAPTFASEPPPQMPATMTGQPTQARGTPRPIQRIGYPQMARASYAPEMMPAAAANAEHMAGGHYAMGGGMAGGMGGPMPAYGGAVPVGHSPARFDQPHMPGYAWPSYAAYPNYAALTYPKQYSPTAWPFIGPFYPYPQVPLGWRKVSLEWDNGWWMLDFKDSH
jgi:hypothetical protein